MLEIHSIMPELAKKQPIFQVEEDFKQNLARLIRDFRPGSITDFEFNPFPREAERIYHDILVESGLERTVIELKYPTEPVDVEHEGKRFTPKLKGLHADGYYDCVKDISKLERTIKKIPDIHFGVFVLLTNRPAFWQKSSASARSATYSLEEGRTLEGKLAYPDNNPPPICLREPYELRWRDYSDLEALDNIRIYEGNKLRFRYLAVEVGN